jgi:hypothetical protein
MMIAGSSNDLSRFDQFLTFGVSASEAPILLRSSIATSSVKDLLFDSLSFAKQKRYNRPLIW